MNPKPGSFKVIVAGMLWRTFGSKSAGAILLDAMSASNEQQRMLAGMMLVKAGDRSVVLIREAVESGRAGSQVVRLLADLGGPGARAVLETLAAGKPGELKDAAEQSLDLLERIDDL